MNTDAEEAARDNYRDILGEYGAALAAREAHAPELLARATEAWDFLRSFDCEEAQLPYDMHLVAALAFAVQATDAAEAKRLYSYMTEEFQRLTDGADGLNPGSLKIWVNVEE